MEKTIFKKVNAVYTGGGIWLFYGETNHGYFLTDDNGATRFLSADPSNLDDSLYNEWQEEHLIKDLENPERLAFCDALINRLLRNNPADDKGGITNEELTRYKEFFKAPL